MTRRAKGHRIKDDFAPTDLEIRDCCSPDVDNIRAWSPDLRSHVYVLLELEIGDKGNDGAELFQLVIATPEGLRIHSRNPGVGVICDRAVIVVNDFSWPELERHLTEIVSSCNGFSWSDAVQKLQKYFRWEYEDHKAD